MDLLTFRFSPSIGQKEVGVLRPTKAHEDTWASNINHQINFWFPFHRVRKKIQFSFFKIFTTSVLKTIVLHGV